MTERWKSGATSGWSSAFGSEIQSLANLNAILSSVSIDNSSNLDTFADFCLSSPSSFSGTAPNTVALYLYPLCEDGSTYGDGRFGSAAAGPPPAPYFVGSIDFLFSSTSPATIGTVPQILIPPGIFKFLIWNQTKAALPASQVGFYRTYNRQA